MEIKFGRADRVDFGRIFAQGHDPCGRILRRDKVVAGQFRITVPVDFVNGARDLAAFHMGAADVVRRTHQRAGQAPRRGRRG